MTNYSRQYLLISLLIITLSGTLLAISDSKKDAGIDELKTINVSHSEEELKLYALISVYRVENNLSSIPLSKSLSYVAQQHCIDLHKNKPDLEEECNAHSWSDQGTWSSCCYTKDHNEAQCMWDKPSELTNYTGYGFEIAAGSSEPIYDDYIMTAEYAVQAWKESIHHNDVILNQAAWSGTHFKAMGVAVHKGFASIWFGREADPEK
jgi:uncharacterized protein YkwD